MPAPWVSFSARGRSSCPWGRSGAAVAAAAWNLHLVPASPTLVDLALSLPVMDTARARAELDWTPTRTSLQAIREFLDGLRDGSGMDTPPLEPLAGGRLREKEVATGVGQRATS